MLTMSFVVGVVLAGWGLKSKHLAGGSLLAGILLGLILIGTPAGPPLAHSVQEAADAVGQGVIDAFRQSRVGDRDAYAR